MASGKIDVGGMISAVAPLSEGVEWFNRLYRKEAGINKVILIP
jgi:L-iditol 2-dehydrogenase